jgi:hypothetical protein
LLVAPVRSRTTRRARFDESEIDMNRDGDERPLLASRISQLIAWLSSGEGQSRGPMRAIARELEEIFPTGDG